MKTSYFQRLVNAISFWSLMVWCTAQLAHAQHSNFSEIPAVNNNVVAVHTNYLVAEGSQAFVNNGDLYLFHNFDNNGQHLFTADNAFNFINFVGTTQQLVRGTGFTDVFHLTIDNPTFEDAIELDQNIHISGEANFADGIIGADDAVSGKLVFKPTASALNISDDSYVDGRVQKIGASPFAFPIGDSDGVLFQYRPLSISSSSNSDNAFTAQYFWSSSNTLYPHDSKESRIAYINDQEYWILTQDVGQSIPDVTLTLDQDTSPTALFDSPEEVTIIRWDGHQWIDEGGVFNPTSNEITTTPTGFGVFTLGLLVKDDGKLFNVISANNDGLNDSWVIPALDLYLDNEVKIYNRWGALIFERTNYVNRSTSAFWGYADGRSEAANDSKLPSGTYFYEINYTDDNNISHGMMGWLYIATD